ncbi:MAG: arginine--tRNA ligase [Pseudomonadota bacterium]
MKQQLVDLFSQAIDQLKTDSIIPDDHEVRLMFERTRQKEHGDFATNVAMTLAKPARKNPRELAELITAALPQDPLITRVEIAGPGFINVFVAQDAQYAVLPQIFAAGSQFGLAEANSKRKIMVEFVSANPTGPLHVGHGRGAAYGDALARVLAAAGNEVEREYYVNDAGRQMDILAVSVWVRYLQRNEVAVALPDNAYQGDYIQEMAADLHAKHGDKYLVAAEDISDARADLDDEAALDATIALAKSNLGADGFAVFFSRAIDSILVDIREDLSAFGVDYDTWFSERSLFDDGKIQAAVEQLKGTEHLYEKGGAWWFKSTAFGDEKDRVVVRENGQPTYFASDIAYHKDKVDRGFDECINIWGADHHGYIARVKASMQALGLDPDKLNVLLVQFAVLYRGGEKVKMSTRSGSFVTLRELREEVGVDAARFFYAQRKSEQHMDFDLDLAKSQSNDNPVYYVQYAHARICSIFNQAEERGITIADPVDCDYSHLSSDHEQALLTLLQRFPEVIQSAANNYEPHQLNYYLRDVATAFHSYYNSTKFLEAEEAQRNAILALCQATRQVLANGLDIIAVSAPESM